ncbi:hypothetical protein [Nonomuraea recticatena]|uniref:hypothetical protein n=1 Tax=Nonomuraea recticatena TaxID=46178 RepID=UPI003614ECA9
MGAARAAAQQDQGRYGGAEHPGGDGRRRPRAIPKGVDQVPFCEIRSGPAS